MGGLSLYPTGRKRSEVLLDDLFRNGFRNPFANQQEEAREPGPEDLQQDAAPPPAPPSIPFEGPLPPTRAERMEQELNAQPSRLRRILGAAVPAAGIALGAAFGGQAGTTGAAQGVNESLDRESILEANRKKTLMEQIQAEREREDRQAQNEAVLNQRVAEMNQSAEQGRLGRENALTIARIRDTEPQPGRDIPFSPEVMEQQLQLKAPAPVAGRDIPLPEAVATQRKELNAPHPVPGRDIPLPLDVEAQRAKLNASRAQLNGLAPQQFNKVQALASQFDSNPVIKDFNVTSNKYATVKQILERPLGGPSDLALVFEFMKGLDPTSVVRESEYETAAKSGNIFKGIYAKFNGYLKAEGGFLPPEVKRSFLGILRQKLNSSSKQVRTMYSDFGRRIDKITGQPNTGTEYLTDYAALMDTESQVPEAATSSRKAHYVGESILLKGGKQGKITKVYPDGSFDVQ